MTSWRRFRETYPSAVLLTLSAVGFNAERTRAVVQVGAQYGPWCGEWRDYYLVGQGGHWSVTPQQSCFAIA